MGSDWWLSRPLYSLSENTRSRTVKHSPPEEKLQHNPNYWNSFVTTTHNAPKWSRSVSIDLTARRPFDRDANKLSYWSYVVCCSWVSELKSEGGHHTSGAFARFTVASWQPIIEQLVGTVLLPLLPLLTTSVPNSTEIFRCDSTSIIV